MRQRTYWTIPRMQDREAGKLTTLRSIPGVELVREIYPGTGAVPEHCHDFVALTIPLLGGFMTVSDAGEAAIAGASVVLHPPRDGHAAFIFDEGLEAVGLHIDVAWLRSIGLRASVDRTRYCNGGSTGAEAAALARLWLNPGAGEADVRARTASFLRNMAGAGKRGYPPKWLARVDRALDLGRRFSARALARELDLHPAWLLQAYRSARGEGVHQTLRRRRVEAAVHLLRCSRLPLAQVSAHAGFCDQSHMNRNFLAVIGRTPGQVRAERFA